SRASQHRRACLHHHTAGALPTYGLLSLWTAVGRATSVSAGLWRATTAPRCALGNTMSSYSATSTLLSALRTLPSSLPRGSIRGSVRILLIPYLNAAPKNPGGGIWNTHLRDSQHYLGVLRTST